MTAPSKAELVQRYGEPDDLADAASNVERADYAWPAIEAFQQTCFYGAERNLTPADYADAESHYIIGDLICDLLHFVTMHGGDAEGVIGQAQRHFEAEVGLGYEADIDDSEKERA